MADRYWVGGTGTWDTTSTTNWSATSGGAGGASVPTVADNVIFDQAATYTVTMTGALACLNITVSAGNVTFATGTTPTLEVRGSMSLLVPAIWTSTGTITFSATTSQTITTTGTSLTCPVTFNGVGGTWTLQDAMTIVGSTRTVTLTTGTLNLNGKTLTTGRFNSSSSNTRTLAFGTGNITVTGTGLVWDMATVTSINITGSRTVNVTNSTSVATTVSCGVLSETTAINFNFTVGTYPLTLNSGNYGTLNFTGFSGTLDNQARGIYGDLTISSTMTLSAAGNPQTFGSTSATPRTITTNGKLLDFPITFSGTGGTWVLQDAMTVGSTRTVQLSAGTLNLNGKTLTAGFFSGTGSTARSIAFGTGNITVNGAGGTLWTTATATNLTTSGTQVVNVSYSGSLAVTITPGSLSEANSISFNFTAGTYGLTLGTRSYRSIDFTGFSGTLSNNTTRTVYGSFTFSAAMTLGAGSGGVNPLFFASTSAVTITSNGKVMSFPVTFNGVGGTFTLNDAMTLSSIRDVTFNNGTVNLNGKTLTAGAAGTGVGTKNITFNGGALVLSASSTATYPLAFSNVAPTGFTTTAGTGTGTISLTSATAKTFAGAGSTFNCTINQGGAGALTITGSNTFDNITNTVQPASVLFTAGTTTTFITDFALSGTAGNLITISSATAAQHTLSKASGIVDVSYCNISYSNATGGATWNAFT